MNAADLRVFAAVARLGSMNRAAAELNTVQSNVTARIRLLEEGLGIRLFDRRSRGVALTPAGTRLLPYANRIADLLKEARRVALDDGTPSGALLVGSLESTAAIRLSPVLSAYAASYPEVDLILRTGTTCELIEEVLQHRIEGAFVCGPVEHPDLTAEPVVREQLVVVTAPAVASLARLLGARGLKIVVLRAGCSYRQRLEEILARRGIVGFRQLEFGTLEAILGCVSAGLGVTLLPLALVERWLDDGRVAIHELPAAEALVETVFIRRRDGFSSSALRAFLELARPAGLLAQAAE